MNKPKPSVQESSTPARLLTEEEARSLTATDPVGVGCRYRNEDTGGWEIHYLFGGTVSEPSTQSFQIRFPLDGRRVSFARTTGIRWGCNSDPNPHYVACPYVDPAEIDPAHYADHHFTEPVDVEGLPYPIGEPMEGDMYRFLYLSFDVHEAFHIIRDRPRDPKVLDVEESMDTFSRWKFDGEPVRDPDAVLQYKRDPSIEGKSFTMGTGVDWLSVPRANPDSAGILCPLITGRALIDGSHRIARAWQLGRESFAVYVLTEEESLQVCPQLEEVRAHHEESGA